MKRRAHGEWVSITTRFGLAALSSRGAKNQVFFKIKSRFFGFLGFFFFFGFLVFWFITYKKKT